MENLNINEFVAGQPIFAHPFNQMVEKINELVDEVSGIDMDSKQNVIENLDDIIAGANAGATALQEETLFNASAAKTITEEQISSWDTVVSDMPDVKTASHTHTNKEVLNQVTQEIIDKVISEPWSTAGYATEVDLLKVANIVGHGVIIEDGENPEIPATGLVAEVEALKNSSLTEDNLAGYATERFVTDKIAEVVGEGVDNKFDTLREVADWILNDTSGAAKLQNDVAELKAINHDEFLKASDIENKADKSEIPSLEGYAKSNEIPSLDGYAKLTDIPSLDTYVQQQDLPNFEEYAKKEDIPSTENLLSLTDADERYQPKGNYLTEHQNIDRLLIKDMVEDTCVKRTKLNDSYQVFVNGQHIEFRLIDPESGLTTGTGLTSWLRHVISNGADVGVNVNTITLSCGDITSVMNNSGTPSDTKSEVDTKLVTFFLQVAQVSNPSDFKLNMLKGKNISLEVSNGNTSVIYKIIVD